MFTSTEIKELYKEVAPVSVLTLVDKPTEARADRPSWAHTDKALALRIFGSAKLRRFQIAHKYWRMNKTAREIADEMDLTLSAVKHVIYYLQKSRPLPIVSRG